MGLHERAVPDFPDSLVALGMLARDGDGPEARYRNTAETAAFLDRASPTYIGGVLEMCNARLYRFWGDLTEALRTGKPQNEVKYTGKPMFDELYSDPARLEQFMNAMTGASMSGFTRWPSHLTSPPARPSATWAARPASCRSSSPVDIRTCAAPPSTFRWWNPWPSAPSKPPGSPSASAPPPETSSPIHFPEADVITMGMILHDWNLEQKMHLIQAAYDALPPGGAFICLEPLIDDERRSDAFALSMSLNMLIEFGDAFGFTGHDFTGWCTNVGFERVDILPLAGPMAAGIAYKSSAA